METITSGSKWGIRIGSSPAAVLFEFPLPDDITQWPSGAPDAATIHVGDPVSGIYAKLLAIYQLPGYGGYRIILPDKPLDKTFDPDMTTYGEWGFSIATVVSSEVRGLYTVRLYFDGGKLAKIWYQYNEGVVYN
ncbi:hypothetical protein Q4E93_05935 [Flavitalea sp. BT771]|uniref:hypothetical protein n=1 Tax=Flavitalea sp. BT771 TaxID=3063329 RepID=UPI0026E34C85|nr:hypothetical protein [Flavitalea sp. BT771]MDO6430114.1 hypothetical protein [Flavitalea sp. BT771]MDV6219747.1 hypothetical protein [Flavitalea sp. BT771]